MAKASRKRSGANSTPDMVQFDTALTDEQLARVQRLPATEVPSSQQLVRSDFREKMERWEQQREEQRQQEYQARLSELANAIASALPQRARKRRLNKPKDEKAKEQQRLDDAKRGDAWLTGRNSGRFVTYNDMATVHRIELWDLRASLDRDRHKRPDVWRTKKKPRRKKSVKAR